MVVAIPKIMVQVDESQRGAAAEYGAIKITLHRANNLIKSDLIGHSDPFVVFRLGHAETTFKMKGEHGSHEDKSSTIQNSEDPVWPDEEFVLCCHHHVTQPELHLSVYDWDSLTSNDFLGEATLPLPASSKGSGGEVTLPLKGLKKAESKGSTVTVSWERANFTYDPAAVKPRDQLRHYMVHVVVGQRQKSAKKAHACVRITGTLGSSDRLLLDHRFHGDSDGPTNDTFPFDIPDIGDPLFVRMDTKGTHWYIEKFEVSSHGHRWTFPFFGWLNKTQPSAMLFEAEARLPSGTSRRSKAGAHEEAKGSDDSGAPSASGAATVAAQSGLLALDLVREEELAMRRSQYEWSDGRELHLIHKAVKGLGKVALIEALPNYLYTQGHHVKPLPEDEKFTGDKHFDYRKTFALALTNLALSYFLNVFDRWDHINEHNALYKNVKRPRVAHVWKEDREIGLQAVQGVAPNLLRRVIHKVRHRDVGVGKLQAEIDARRIYCIDLEVLHGCRLPGTKDGEEPLFKDRRGQRYLAVPLMLLHVDPERGHDIYPVAIQLGQDPTQYCIFTPNDSELDWMVAKMHYKCAEYNLHQMGVHALRTHLCMEPLVVATMRNLSVQHPVYKLLRRHQRFTLEINTRARGGLISEGGPFDDFCSSGHGAHIELAIEFYKSFDFFATALPEDLKARGVDDHDAFPHYPYRDDGMLMWEAIAGYVRDTLGLFYKTDADVVADLEVQAWARDLAESGIRGKFDADRCKTLAGLQLACTIVIWTMSCQHSAVNFGQWEYLGYIPAAPLVLYGPPPKVKGTFRSEKDVMKILPSKHETTKQIAVVHTLAMYSPKEEYMLPTKTKAGSWKESFFPPKSPGEQCVVRFHQALEKVEEMILDANKRRGERGGVEYKFMIPSNVPTSIAI